MDWSDLLDHLGFSETDERRLAALWPAVAARTDPILDAFHERVLEPPMASLRGPFLA